jgi:phasin family protein
MVCVTFYPLEIPMQNAYNDMMKMWSQFKMPNMQMPNIPNVNLNNVVNLGKKNIEACSGAYQCMVEGSQEIARRQVELARSSAENTLKTAKDLLVNGSPEINTAKQAAFAKNMIEQNLSNLREICELYTKSGFEAFDVINKRAAECFEEIGKLNK